MAKTLKIANLLDIANAFFENSADSARMERIAVQHFVENLLHQTGAYAGFGYSKPYGTPGADTSRIFFYRSNKL